MAACYPLTLLLKGWLGCAEWDEMVLVLGPDDQA
jgi:hypothetical protein